MLDNTLVIDGNITGEAGPTIEELRLEQAKKLNDAASALQDDQDQFRTAIIMYKRAIELAPNLAHPTANLGLWYFRLGDHAKGIELMTKAAEMDPTNHTYWGNLGVSHGTMGNYEKSVECLKKSLTIKDGIDAKWDLALSHMKFGHWDVGLQGYECRFEHRGTALYPEFPAPLWKGEDLADKHILVQCEQGIGDRLFHSRFVAVLREKYPTAKISMAVSEPLINLFWGFTKHGISLLPSGIPFPKDIDYLVWIASLPGLFGATLETLPPDPGWFIERLNDENTKCRLPTPDLPSLKVGIAWTGNPAMLRNSDRSMPLQNLLSLAEDSRIQLYNFQCGAGYNEFKRMSAGVICADLAPDLEKEGLVGTAIAMQEMDLVITVCTSIAHIAGVLQIPCWTLLCADPYWIWGLEGETTPWYPKTRLFRQKTLGDWTPVMVEVRKNLNYLLTEKGI
jgi:hypothetical protein